VVAAGQIVLRVVLAVQEVVEQGVMQAHLLKLPGLPILAVVVAGLDILLHLLAQQAAPASSS
jgi:hypothetical protein